MNRSLLWLSLVFGAALLSSAWASSTSPATPVLPKGAGAGGGLERFVCAARVDCGRDSLPSTQELPTLSVPSVQSRSPEAARAKCGRVYHASYRRLLLSMDPVSPETALRAARGCRVSAEALGR